MKNANTRLYEELVAMKEVGIRVSNTALRHAMMDDLTEYESMSNSELASLYVELYG